MSDFTWFDDARFGMFIHWGVYALAARGEWVRKAECLTNEEYEKYVRFFEPDLFEPEKWAALAKNAGMKYVVFTTKHHDGFCMWDSRYSDYNSARAPRCRRDLLRDTVAAFRAEGIRIGLYHSLPDWHHPNYVIDERHPLRAKPEFKDCRTPFERNPEIYTKYLRSQVEELLVNYGKIDIIWFDSVYPETEKYFDCRRLNDMIRKLQPGILINRLPGFSDFHSPEQSIPANGVRDDGGRLLRWEGCQVISEYAWGYLRNGQTVKKNGEILQMLVRHVSRGGNLLLNIAPTSRGAIDRRSEHLLLDIGEWMRWHSRSIHNCTVAPEEFPEPEGCRYTWNPERRCLYLHMFVWPDRRIILPKLAGKVEYAQLLCDGSEILLTEHMPGNINCSKVPPGDLMLSLPVARPDTELPVIELFLKS